MKKTSTEVFGVINLNQLEVSKLLIHELSELLLYPEEKIVREDFELIQNFFTDNREVYDNLQSFFTFLEMKSLQEQQEFYVDTFDFNKKTTLYMTYAKYEDAKERGKLLVQLKMIYDNSGLELVEKELSDFLPLILEFLANGEWESEKDFNKMLLVMAVVEDGSFHLFTELKKQGNAYAHVIQVVRIVLKSCLKCGTLR